MTFATAKFNSAVATFKKTFGTHPEMFTYGQFYVTNKTIADVLKMINAELSDNLRFMLDSKQLEATLKWFREKLQIDVQGAAVAFARAAHKINVAEITAMLDLIERDGDLAAIRAMFKSASPKQQELDAADVRRTFNEVWSDDNIPASAWVDHYPSLGKALAAHKLESDRCHQVSSSLARKITTSRKTAPPPTAALLDGQLAGAGPVETVRPSPATHDSGQQIIRHTNPSALPAAYAKMKKTIDADGFVHCGVLSGARGPFPQPEHWVLAFAYDVIDGKDAFLFWDPDATRSNIASTSPSPGVPGWGPGFGMLFATATRLSTATDDADLKAIDRINLTNPFFGDHTTDTRRHCYQVYYMRSLPMPKRVKLHTKVVAPPRHTSVDTMLHNTITLYESYGVEIIEASREDLTGPDGELDRFRTLYCGFGDEPTAELTDLHEMFRSDDRGFGVTPAQTDIVVAIVNHLVPAALGSSKSPAEKPGVVVSAAATDWTLAHELGHVLGLDDVSDPTNLMHISTGAITVTPPQLAAADVTTIGESPLAG